MSVETLFIILLLALLANAIFIWLIFKRVVGKPELEEKKDTGLNLLLQQMHELTRTVD